MRFDCDFIGPLLTSGFTGQGLPALLSRRGLYLNETDDNWRAMRQGLRDFAALPIKDEVRPLILKDNAARLFGLG